LQERFRYWIQSFKQLGIAGKGTKLDYMYLLILLYEMGTDANVEFMAVTKPMIHDSYEALFNE
jgi:hypothetical protein